MKSLLATLLVACLLPFCALGQELLININMADKERLMELKGIGPVRAQRIIDSREENGPFKTKAELLERKLIPSNVFKRIRSQISLSGESVSPAASEKNVADILRENRFNGEIWLLEDSNFFKVLMDKLEKAKRSVHLVTFVFKTSSYPKNKATLVAKALERARQKNLSVKAVLEYAPKNVSLNNSNGNSLQELRSYGVDVRFDDPQRTLHSKIVVIDGEWSFIGSHNMTDSALGRNREVSLLIRSKKMAEALLEYINQL